VAESNPIKIPLRPSALLERQRAAFLRDGPPSLAQRRADLLRLKKAVLARRAELENAARSDFGHRSAHETAIMDLVPVVQSINHLRHHVARWMRPVRRPVALTYLPGRARVIYQPLGVIGIVSPWNFPISLALMPLAAAIGAGNRAMLKPSELAPATSEVIAAMLRGIFDPEQVAVVTGGAEVGAAFTALPFDHLLFTGSTQVGRAVMRAASENLVPVTLELGGKSPAIVEPGSSLERAARSIAYGKLANAGQICIAPDYVLVHEQDRDGFVRAYTDSVRKLYPGGASDDSYTSIINARHHSRLLALLDDARARHAEIIEIDTAPAGPARPCTLAPTLILNATDDMAIMQQEIFGPILPIVCYRSIDEAVSYVNARPHPLALYYFGSDGAARREVLQRTTSGNVTINDTLLHFMQEELPFGGVGPSGMGAYHGFEGFKALSHERGIFEQSRWNFAATVRPPFGSMVDRVLTFLLR
jgi:coniferyl-aldehyde dehydrogenase